MANARLLVVNIEQLKVIKFHTRALSTFLGT